MLGDDIVDGYRCLQHDSHDEQNLIPLGKTSWGNPIRVNRQYLEADVRILTGFIEPHFFAGYSGGPKAVLPSLAGFESVGSNHSAANIAHPNATWGKTEGNPIWEEMKEVALRTNPTFMLNVTLNADGQITSVFAGDMLVAHAAGCAFIAQTAMVPVGEPFDIIITTNSGYPLDLNLYQSVKGMSAAAQIVRQGGAIIMATACEDGVPDHGGYAELLQRGGSPQGVLDMVTSPGFNQPDQWQVQIQAMVQSWADVFIYSEGLTDDQIRGALLMPCRDISHTLAQLASRLNHKASIAVLPEGPQTIPYVTDR
jgi:nickel-dependent lactate racemase